MPTLTNGGGCLDLDNTSGAFKWKSDQDKVQCSCFSCQTSAGSHLVMELLKLHHWIPGCTKFQFSAMCLSYKLRLKCLNHKFTKWWRPWRLKWSDISKKGSPLPPQEIWLMAADRNSLDKMEALLQLARNQKPQGKFVYQTAFIILFAILCRNLLR